MEGREHAAIVLRVQDVGEADRIVALLTPDLGKVDAAARRARASSRRFAGGLPAGAVGHAQLQRGRGALWRLDGFRADHDVGAIARDLEAFAYTAYLCELTDQLVLEAAADPTLFVALELALRTCRDGAPSPSVLRRYELQLLDALGSMPGWDACCACGEPLDPSEVDDSGGAASVGWDAQRGGALCAAHDAGAPRLPLAAVTALATLAGAQPGSDPLAGAPAAVRRAVRDALHAALRVHLRRPLRSLAFFAQLQPRIAPSGASPRGDAPGSAALSTPDDAGRDDPH